MNTTTSLKENGVMDPLHIITFLICPIKEVIEQGLKTEKFVMNFVTISSAVDRFHDNGK
jgi:hypothetical protein